MQEIERKFLVKSDEYKSEAIEKKEIIQGFLNTDPERVVRIRISAAEAFLTVKGKSSEDGLSRFEWEKEISPEEARELLKLCEPGIIDKYRYVVEHMGSRFEIDEFSGENQGLVIAELELETEDSEFRKPAWLGQEVTGEIRYYNSFLSKKPFKNW